MTITLNFNPEVVKQGPRMTIRICSEIRGSYTRSESSSKFGNPATSSNLAYQARMLQLGFRFSF